MDMHACRYKLLKSVAKEYRGRIDFVWIEGGAQPELEAALNLGFGNLSDVRTSLVYLPTQRDRKKKRRKEEKKPSLGAHDLFLPYVPLGAVETCLIYVNQLTDFTHEISSRPAAAKSRASFAYTFTGFPAAVLINTKKQVYAVAATGEKTSSLSLLLFPSRSLKKTTAIHQGRLGTTAKENSKKRGISLRLVHIHIHSIRRAWPDIFR